LSATTATELASALLLEDVNMLAAIFRKDANCAALAKPSQCEPNETNEDTDLLAQQTLAEPELFLVSIVDLVSPELPLDESNEGGRLLLATVEKLLTLRKLQAEFTQRLQSEKIAAMKQLAYGASHEINNPLANISTRAQTLLREEESPERRRKLATINSQALRAHEMIANMMLFAHPPQLELESVAAQGIVADVMEEVADRADIQGSELRRQEPKSEIMLRVDRRQLTFALKAVVRNSLEALASGGAVEVMLRRSAKCLEHNTPACEFVVNDNGPGIPTDAQQHLFDPFYSGREAGRGLGFGLATCWRIIELHGGEIEFASEPGEGASFTLRLPLETRED